MRVRYCRCQRPTARGQLRIENREPVAEELAEARTLRRLRPPDTGALCFHGVLAVDRNSGADMSQIAPEGESPSEAGPVAKLRSLVSVADLPPPMSERLRLASAMAEVALSVQEDGLDLGERLQILVDGAVQIVPGADCAAIVVPEGQQRLTARAVCGQLPPEVVWLQSDLGEGPCLTAVAQTDRVCVPDVARDPRWPRFASRAAAWGVRSMICPPLVLGPTVLGSLSLGPAAVDAFDEESASLA